MSQIEVLLEIPNWIAHGLASGQLERVGGVVREVGSKQIVAWLREGGRIAENTDLAGGVLKTLLNASTGGLASTATGLLNTAVTARSHYLIMQQLGGLTNLVGVTAGIGVINLTVSAASLAILLQRLNKLEEKIDGLHDVLEREREANLQAGLDAAQDAARAAGAGDDNNKREYARQAIDRLREARQPMHDKLEDLLSGGNTEVLVAHLMRALQIDTVMIRCYLDNADAANAKEHVSEALNKYRHTVKEVIHRLLGTQRAVYFHQTVSDEDLWRYTYIRQWLSDEDKELDQLLVEAVFADRNDFWNQEIIESLDPADKRRSIRERIKPEAKESEGEIPHHLRALAVSDALIENYKRLQGIEAELEAIERLQVSHSKWQSMQDAALEKAEMNLAQHDDLVFLAVKDTHSSVERLSAFAKGKPK